MFKRLHMLPSSRTSLFLTEDVLDQFTIGGHPKLNGSPTGTSAPPFNSHLALLAMVDCWAHLKIQPFYHLDLAATPIFRMWIGVAEYLFRSLKRLDTAIHSAVYDVTNDLPSVSDTIDTFSVLLEPSKIFCSRLTFVRRSIPTRRWR